MPGAASGGEDDLFFLRVIRRVLQIAAIPFAIFAFYGPYSYPTVTSFVAIFVSAATALGLMALSRKIGQRIYDINATALYKQIVEGHRETFSVFLRPFYVTNELAGEKSPGINSILSVFFPVKLLEPVQLVEAMRRKSPVVGLGRPGEALGVGRILTNEEDWRAAATKLIDRAMYIFCIPSSRAGTLWEIDHVLEHNLLAKTIFIMPPLSNAKPIWRKIIGLEDDWGNLIVEMKKRGLSFPQYKNNGMLFRITSATSIETTPFSRLADGVQLPLGDRKISPSSSSLLSRPKARRIVANVAKVLEFLSEGKPF
jgi:hypothetical protein